NNELSHCGVLFIVQFRNPATTGTKRKNRDELLSSDESELESDAEGEQAVDRRTTSGKKPWRELPEQKRVAPDVWSKKPATKGGAKMIKIVLKDSSMMGEVDGEKESEGSGVRIEGMESDTKFEETTVPTAEANHVPSQDELSKKQMSSVLDEIAGQIVSKDGTEVADIMPMDEVEGETVAAAGQVAKDQEAKSLEMEMEVDMTSESSPYITLTELEANRIPKDEWQSLPAFKRYTPGDPSTTLYIKNLAYKTVTVDDLLHVFGRYCGRGVAEADARRISSVFTQSSSSLSQLDIRFMKEGRMKGQAFVRLRDVVTARRALDEVCGYMLKGKPMVVQFGKGGREDTG
ncbi:hypothetical protein BC938DRAFT_475412, partial [Jimgerdemannia flammicorona]